jgi:hypothetical protein
MCSLLKYGVTKRFGLESMPPLINVFSY